MKTEEEIKHRFRQLQKIVRETQHPMAAVEFFCLTWVLDVMPQYMQDVHQLELDGKHAAARLKLHAEVTDDVATEWIEKALAMEV